MILPIHIYGHPALRKVATNIPDDFTDLETLVDDLFETMKNAHGIGLAGPQVGLHHRIFVADTTKLEFEDKGELKRKQEFINPQITALSGEKVSINEGCLSIPAFRADISREESLTISYFDCNWQEFEEEFSGMFARVILHEFDHINGKLFFDRLNTIKKEFSKKQLKKISEGEFNVEYPFKLYK